MSISHMKLNGISCPMGYEPGPLLLSWQVEGSAGNRPVNSRIQVVDQAGIQVWETEGALSWEGTPLAFDPKSFTCYTVQVTVMDDLDETHAGETWFETGRMDRPWQGVWIGPDAVPDYAPVLSRQFSCRGRVESARLYITGLGLYAVELNGQPVTRDVLLPGLWDYEEEVQCQAYDVTALLQEENHLEVTLGNGWYRGRFGLDRTEPWGSEYALLAEMRIRFADGGEQTICTDGSWTWHEGQIHGGNGIYDGEYLDRLHAPGLDRPVAYPVIPLRVVDRVSLPVREMDTLPVAEVIHTPAGETVLDFGQNHTGWLRFHAKLSKGTEVRLEFGEILQKGNFYNENYRTATGGFRYRSDGREETVCQRFTYFGFRYVKVTGWTGELDPANFDSPVLYSEMDRIGWLSTGHKNLNRLYENALWGQRSNFLDIPTDCPQRDERLGWTGDAQVFAPTACYNMDCRAFYRSFLRFLRREQNRMDGAVPTYIPTMGNYMAKQACAIWSDSATFIPDTLLRFYGSAEGLAEHYPMMRDWVDWVERLNPGRLYSVGGQLGDWLALDGVTPQSFNGGTDGAYLASVYWMASARIVARFAQLLGNAEDAARYSVMAEEIRATVLDAYFTPAGRLSVDTQAAYVAALRFGVWRDKEVLLEQFRRRLRYDGYQIRCGFAGAPLLCSTLADHGMGELACDLLLQRGFPGWMYCVELGATTIWERWNSLLPDGTCSGTGMNSFNHYAYGSVMEYVYGHLAGLKPGERGFRDAVIAPHPDVRLGHLSCTCRTAAGQYVSSWRICADGMVEVHVEVPFGCTANVTLPRSNDGALELSAGSYDWRYQPTQDYRRMYSMASRLSALAGDERAEALLEKLVPPLYGVLARNDLEFTTQTLEELKGAFFLGVQPGQVEALAEHLSKLLYPVEE